MSSIACAEAKEAAKAEARAVPNPKSYSDSPRAQAKEVAGEAAKAEARAAASALRAVEAGIAVYAERRDYLKLKDIAEASDVAGKVAPRPAPLRLLLCTCALQGPPSCAVRPLAHVPQNACKGSASAALG